MGFPACCSAEADLFLPRPRILLRIALLLGHLRRLISLAFRAVGLTDLLDADDSCFGDHVVAVYDYGRARQRFDELAGAEGHVVAASGGCCAVCLCEFERREEKIRRLPNCRHVFHCGCLGPWLELGRRTCPLCRAPLVAGEMPLGADNSLWLESESNEFAI